jgi:hypothetical protein
MAVGPCGAALAELARSPRVLRHALSGLAAGVLTLLAMRAGGRGCVPRGAPRMERLRGRGGPGRGTLAGRTAECRTPPSPGLPKQSRARQLSGGSARLQLSAAATALPGATAQLQAASHRVPGAHKTAAAGPPSHTVRCSAVHVPFLTAKGCDPANLARATRLRRTTSKPPGARVFVPCLHALRSACCAPGYSQRCVHSLRAPWLGLRPAAAAYAPPAAPAPCASCCLWRAVALQEGGVEGGQRLHNPANVLLGWQEGGSEVERAVRL